MRYFIGLMWLGLLSMPTYVVLRSFAIDDAGLFERLCTGFVAAMLTQAWLKNLHKE